MDWLKWIRRRKSKTDVRSLQPTTRLDAGIQSTVRYDAAISFSGKDREIARDLAYGLKARGLRVFYDEWAKADLLGKDLTQHLDTVYRFQANYCVVLLSESYKSSLWTQHELKSALDRSLSDREDYLLPIKLDDVEIPGIRSTVGYIDFNDYSTDEVADIISAKLTSTTVNQAVVEPVSPEHPATIVWPTAPTTSRVNGFERQAAEQPLRIMDKDILERARLLVPSEDPRARWRLAAELSRRLSFLHNVVVGTQFTCWRDDHRFFLSMLPSVARGGHKTLEFEFASGDTALELKAEWTSSNDQWGPIEFDPFHSLLKGLSADRSGCNMNRESVLYYLSKQGRRFSFPVVPIDDSYEPLCGWVEMEPGVGWVDFDRNPRLVDAQINMWQALCHELSEAGILYFTIQGTWSNNALYAFYDALDFLLPERHVRKLLDGKQSVIRVWVYLADMNSDSIQSGECDRCQAAISRTYSSIGRAVAALRELPVSEPSETAIVESPGFDGIAKLDSAARSFGEQEFMSDVHDYPGFLKTDRWSKISYQPMANRLGLDHEPFPFDFRDVVLSKDLLEYIERHESNY